MGGHGTCSRVVEIIESRVLGPQELEAADAANRSLDVVSAKKQEPRSTALSAVIGVVSLSLAAESHARAAQHRRELAVRAWGELSSRHTFYRHNRHVALFEGGSNGEALKGDQRFPRGPESS